MSQPDIEQKSEVNLIWSRRASDRQIAGGGPRHCTAGPVNKITFTPSLWVGGRQGGQDRSDLNSLAGERQLRGKVRWGEVPVVTGLVLTAVHSSSPPLLHCHTATLYTPHLRPHQSFPHYPLQSSSATSSQSVKTKIIIIKYFSLKIICQIGAKPWVSWGAKTGSGLLYWRQVRLGDARLGFYNKLEEFDSLHQTCNQLISDQWGGSGDFPCNL